MITSIDWCEWLVEEQSLGAVTQIYIPFWAKGFGATLRSAQRSLLVFWGEGTPGGVHSYMPGGVTLGIVLRSYSW